MASVKKARYSLGLDFGTESVRALLVDCETGEERAQSISKYARGVMTEKLPVDFALQSATDYRNSMLQVIQEVLQHTEPNQIVGIGVDFTACTILPVKKDGTPLEQLPELASNPHAWVKLWKHHAAQPEADRINELASERGEAFLKYYSGIISSEWMLPKCWEIARKAPAVYEAADLIVDAGDWVVQQITGQWTRNACAAGYKGFWNEELGFPSTAFLSALDPVLENLPSKWLKNIVAPGKLAGRVTKSFAEASGLIEGTPVSAATIDAHSGVAGMGVYSEGPMSIIMGTSSCHMVLSRELKFFPGFAGVVKDGILPRFYGYESGQPAVGDLFGWFAKMMDPYGGANVFATLSAKASQLKPGESGLVALDWMNGNRSVLMNGDLSGAILGLTLQTRPEEIYRALIEGSAFGTRMIVEAHQNGGVPVRELVVCGGLVQDPLILQIYADVTGLPVKVAKSKQAVALGSAIFGALAAGSREGGYDIAEDAIVHMTQPASKTYEPQEQARGIYQQLYAVYREIHDQFGRHRPDWMKALKEIKKGERS